MLTKSVLRFTLFLCLLSSLIIRQWHIIHVHLRNFAVDHAVF